MGATGTAPLTYQWSKKGSAIAGATESSYTTPATLAGDDGATFTVEVTNGTGSVTSRTAMLAVTEAVIPPTIIAQPVNQSVTVGGTATFSVTATGTAPLTYQWSKNGASIGGAITSTYTTPATVIGDNGATFTVEVINGAGSALSGAATLSVTSSAIAPSVTMQPADQMVAVGAQATFTVQASGTAPLTYQWSKNGTAIAGAKSLSFTTPAAVIGDNGSSFSVQITNSAGAVSSNAAVLTVNNVAPAITTQPKSQTVQLGATARFGVIATGTSPLTYQWLKNGIAVSAATASSYTTPATSIADNGAIFTVRVTNSAGNIISAAAILTVNATAPTITAQPQNQSVLVGGTAAFSVTATGTAPLTYQWFKKGTAITGATSPSYTTPATVIGDDGATFTVKVTNSAGNITSSAATLSVTAVAAAPGILTQPANQTVSVGSSATFAVTASGTAPLTYQWSKSGTAISGATGASYTTPATVLGDSGKSFTVKITNSAGNITSAAAILTVNGIAPTFTAQPQNRTVVVGSTATFSVSASGTPAPTYQWAKNGTPISGATGAVYTTPVAALSDNGAIFTVVASNSVGSVTSNPATLTVTGIAPTISSQPQNQTVNVGAKATFTVSGTGTPAPTYQWSKNGTAISGATSPSYTTPVTVIGDSGATFTVKLANSAGSATSAAATLTVNGLLPIITAQPQNQTVLKGATATFSVTATGTPTPTYQWSKNGTAIGGATSAAYTTPATVSGDNGASFTVKVTNTGGSIVSNVAILTVNSPPTITAQPQNQNVTVGSTATFSVSATGTGTLTYQWSKGSAAISGATGSSYTTPATVSGDSGASFTVKVTNAFGNASSNAATLTVSASGTVSVSPQLAPLTTSQTQQFTASVTSNWSVDGVRGGNASAGTISINGLYTPGSAMGTHVIQATNASDSTQSGTASAAVTNLAGIYTFHNDAARTGQNLQEYALSPTVVKSANFGKVWACPVDGAVYAQPLYVANLSIGGGKHNVVYIATEHDSVYAFDADSSSCTAYWTRHLVGGSVTSVPVNDLAPCGDTPTEIGITGTPVIDPSTQTLYFVSKTKESGAYFQRLHRVSITTGAEQSGSPATIAASDSTNTFSALHNHQKPGLALANGTVYIGWSSHCDNTPYVGWFMSYDASSLTQTGVFDVTPNSSSGQGGIWMSGGAPAVDSSGGVYLTSGNGSFSTSAALPLASPVDLSMSFIKYDPGSLAAKDFYSPSSEAVWSASDLDISSSGVTVLPDGAGPTAHPNLVFGSDKQDHLWLLDRSNMGGFSSFSDSSVQHISGPTSCRQTCVFSTPAYYSQNKTFYLGISGLGVTAMPLSNGLIGTSGGTSAVVSSQSVDVYGFPGPTPSITASPGGGAVVWAMDTSQSGANGASAGPTVLRAYDATNLATRLYSSSALAADAGPNAVKFAVPMVANGRVYVGGVNAVTVYGPLH